MSAWLNRAIAFFLAWGIVYLAFAIVNELLVCQLLIPYEIGWICVGIGVRLFQNPPVALPEEERIDVRGALLFLGSCAAWPYRPHRH